MQTISEKEYKEGMQRYLDAYHLGLKTALSEIESDDSDYAKTLFIAWDALKSDYDKRVHGDNVARLILDYTGRTYLYKRLPALGDFT